MTIDATTPIQTHVIAGIGPYGTTWPYSEGSISVGVVDADGVVAMLLPEDYTVTPASTDTAGNVFLQPDVAADLVGFTLYLERSTPEEQGWIGNLSARERGLEAQLDVIVMAAQERRGGVDRSLRATVPMSPFAPGAIGTTLIRTATGYGPGPSAADIAAAQANAAAAALAAAQAALFAGPWVDDFFAVGTDALLTYAPGQPSTVVPGQYVRTRKEGYSYLVLAPDAVTHDRITAGGVKLDVVPGERGYDVRALGAGGALMAVDTAAIQKAALKGRIYISAGTPLLVDRIALEPQTVIRGDGAFSVLKKVGETRHLFELPLGTEWSDIDVAGVTFDGDCDNEITRDSASSLIYFGADTGRLVVKDCAFLNPRGRGVFVRSTGQLDAAQVVVCDNLFTGGKECEMNAVTPSLSKTTQYVTITDAADADVSNNRMSLGYTPVGTGLAAIVITTFDVLNALQPSKVTVIGNSLTNLGQAGSVSGAGALGAIECYKGAGRAIIQGNRLAFGTGRQINVKCDSGDNVISGNVVFSMRDLTGVPQTDMGPAIVVNGSVEDTGSVEDGYIITNNRVRNCPLDAIFITGTAVYGAGKAGGFVVSNNVLTGVGRSGVRVRDIRSAMVTGNYVEAISNGIDWQGVTERLTILNNDFISQATPIASFGAGTGTEDIIVGNNRAFGTVALAAAGGGILLQGCGGGHVFDNDVNHVTGIGIRILNPAGPHTIHDNKMGLNIGGISISVTGDPGGNAYCYDNTERKVGAQTDSRVTAAAGTVNVWKDVHYLIGDATNITTITGGFNGQVLTLIGMGTGVTIAAGAALKVNSNWTSALDKTITLRRSAGVWYEVSRSA